MLPCITKYRLTLFILMMLVVIICTRAGLSREWRLTVERIHFGCYAITSSSQSCIMKYYNNLVRGQGVRSTLADVSNAHGRYPSVRTLCHQITHTIGRGAAEGNMSLGALFAEGDPLCGSGYYHGLVEGKMRGIGSADITPTFMNNFCANMTVGRAYQFDYANCTHGIGHALMYVSDNNLPIALTQCSTLVNTEDRSNCTIGVFMENIVVSTDEVGHDTEFIRKNDMYFPCTIVTQSEFVPACYVAQAAHIWQYAEGPADALRICRDLPDSRIQDACTSGLGRVIADNTAYSQSETITQCRDTPIDSQFNTCIMGAMEAFIVHYRDTDPALALCRALPTAVEAVCGDERIAEFRNYIGD